LINRTCFAVDGDADQRSVLGTASRCSSATDVAVVGAVAGGVRRWVTRDGDGDRGDVGGRGLVRGHRGA